MPATLHTCSPRASTSWGGMATTCQSSAHRMMSAYTLSRSSGVSSLESARPGIRRIVAQSRTTAATTSGPAQAPRPASSIPATGDRPARASTFSYAASPAFRRGV